MRRAVQSGLSVCLLLALAAPSALAVRAPHPSEALPDHDWRLDRGQQLVAALALQRGTMKPSDLVAGPAATPGPLREAAVAALEARLGTRLVVRWDPITGSPQMLWARSGFLTPPSEAGFETLARAFLREHRDLFLLSEKQVSGLRLDSTVPAANGGAMLWFHQEIEGREALHAHLGIGFTRDGRVLHVAGGGVTGAGSLESTVPAHAPADAVVALAQLAGVALQAAPRPVAQHPLGADFVIPEFSNAPVRVRQVVIPTAWGPRLGWETDLDVLRGPSWYEVVVEDRFLQPVRRANRTKFADTRGRVFAVNPGRSTYDVERFPDRDDYRSDLSPLGWSATDLTAGNNTFVQDDIANDDEATPGRFAQATPPPPYFAFDFPFTDNPANDLECALTGLFRNVNVAHDWFQTLGFDEPSGNFQVENFGQGGQGGDPVLGDAQDGGGTNNANFSTPPDGLPGRMQMYLWDLSGSKDGSLDFGIVLHEYGHGVSTRLVGGPSEVACLFGLQGGSMGEGWSDYFSASYLNDPVIGAWVSGDTSVGIRMFSLDDNPPTGKDYRDFCTYANDFAPTFCEPHDNGEIWAGFTWLVRDAFIAAEGTTDGVRKADQVIVDGLKFTPCAPSFLDARDAIILADRAAYDGAHECLIKQAAANRWMGFGASSSSGADTNPVAMNDQWPECVDTGTVSFSRAGLEEGLSNPSYACDDSVTVRVVDGNATLPLNVTITSSGGDSETVALAATVDPAVFTGTLSQLAGAPSPGDGTLQAAAGETLTVSYVDPDQAGPVTARAAIDCAARLRIVRHQFRNGTCDDDVVPGYPTLPGYLDAGESAELDLYIENLMPVRVNGAIRVATDRPDLITVLPATAAVPVSLPAATGSSPAETVLTIKLVGADTIVAGDTANLQLSLVAPGYDPLVTYALPLDLHLDYQLVTGLSTSDDLEGETGGPVGPAWSTGLLQAGSGNNWTVVTCANTTAGGTRSYRNGPANCAGRYSDTQADPYLASPALSLTGPSTVAARITNVSFQHDCDLGSVGIPMFGVPDLFDAEAVGLFVTNDPASLDTVDVFSLTEEAIAFFAQLELLGITSNTTAWQPQSVDVNPIQLSGTDLLAPVHLSWVFLTDVTPSSFMGFPFDEQGRGYYVDDIVVSYERVEAIPQGTLGCVGGPTVYALPVVTEPAAIPPVACAGDLVKIDAGGSDSALCGPPSTLELRFLVDGAPVPCFEDATGTTPRVQDPDGWGLGTLCHDFPVEDTTYVLEVRCAATPGATDSRSVTVRVLGGTPVIEALPATFCARTPDTVTLDASASSVTGCTGGEVRYLFTDGAGARLDCDGDTVIDDYSTTPTCVVGPSDGPADFELSLQCSLLPTCAITQRITVPSAILTANGEDVNPASPAYCAGETFTVTALGAVPSTVAGCPGGVPEYRWRSPEGFDSGWSPQPEASTSLLVSASMFLEVRCSLNPACIANFALPMTIREGAVTLVSSASPDDCAGSAQTLAASQTTPLTCATGTIEYRFLEDDGSGPVTVACLGRTQDVDGWGAADTCDTPVPPVRATYSTEARCTEAPTCVVASSGVPVIANPGVPTGTGTLSAALRVTRTAGCPGPGDVVLDWSLASVSPPTFAVFRNNDDTLDVASDRLADADGAETYTDVGASCDNALGTRFRGVAVHFYVVMARNGCTGDPVP